MGWSLVLGFGVNYCITWALWITSRCLASELFKKRLTWRSLEQIWMWISVNKETTNNLPAFYNFIQLQTLNYQLKKKPKLHPTNRRRSKVHLGPQQIKCIRISAFSFLLLSWRLNFFDWVPVVPSIFHIILLLDSAVKISLFCCWMVFNVFSNLQLFLFIFLTCL